MILFSGLAVAAYAGLFNVLETHFYQPTVVASIEGQMGNVSTALEGWHAANTEKFAKFVNADAVKRSVLPNQSAQDIFDRTNLAGALMAEMPGLTGIRIIDASTPGTVQAAGTTAEEDKGTRHIQFSTFSDDLLKKGDFQIAYDNYGKKDGDIPFKDISRADGDKPRVLTDPDGDRFLYCLPFHDAYGAWRGTAVFYVAGRQAIRYLVEKNLFRMSDDLTLLTDERHEVSGVVTGMPGTGKSILAKAVIDRWARQDFTTDKIVSSGDSGWVLVSKKTGEYGFTGQLVPETLFVFPQSIRILFLSVSFLTIFLIVFLLFNLRQDEMVIVRNRIKRFQFQLLSELMENGEDFKWDEVTKNLAYRKHDVSESLKKSFSRRMKKKHEAEIDALLDKSWEDILTALGHREEKQSALSNTEEIRLMLEQVLQNNAISLNLTGVPAAKASSTSKAAKTPAKKAAAKPVAVTDEPEELSEVEELDEVEELAEEPAELADVEDLAEEPEELADVEELDEEPEELADVEELAEEPEELADVEELAEEPEELADVEELAEEPEELAEVEELAEEQEEIAEVTTDTEEIETAEQDGTNESTSEETRPEKAMPTAEIEMEEVDEAEFVDEKWEPELLEEANEKEAAKVVAEKTPDTVLVYNFEETPHLDGTRVQGVTGEADLANPITVSGLDFSELDTDNNTATTEEQKADTGEATNVDYIESFLLDRMTQIHHFPDNGPIYEFLEVIGEEEPAEMFDLEESPESESDSIVNRDGLFMIAPGAGIEGNEETIDQEFKKLVDSVL
jgi:hypothetical protein